MAHLLHKKIVGTWPFFHMNFFPVSEKDLSGQSTETFAAVPLFDSFKINKNTILPNFMFNEFPNFEPGPPWSSMETFSSGKVLRSFPPRLRGRFERLALEIARNRF